MTPLPAPDRWRIIAPLLEEALGLAPGLRPAFLDQVCAGDPGLRREIEDLLSADSEAGAFLDAPVDLSALAPPPGEDAEAAPDATRLAGTSIGPYRVVREIGRGGMGVVYEAEQQQPRRPVALKVILGGRHIDAEAVRMFQREADSLARLRHPSIASIYQSGSTEDGQHFFAMELVQGRTLSEHLEAGGGATTRRDLRRRLATFRKICAAVAYAHQRGVIHRDLKPSNILVLPRQADGTDDAPDIKVLDFGLARITDPEAEAVTAVTAIGRIQGTLPYMSPEQVRGRRDDVDVRTDVYSLGVIAYRMLTGRLPYHLDGADFPEAARIVCEVAPRPLRPAAGGRVKFDHDLEVIVLRALEKEPGRRYASVAALDEDLGRYLAGQPILARPPSAAYQIRKLVARHRLPFATAAMALIALLGFAVVTTMQARRIAAERDRANREARTALKISDFLIGLFAVSDPNQSRGNTVTAREILDKGFEKIGKELADEPEVQARLMGAMGNVYANLGLFREAGPILEQAFETQRRLLGDENLDTLRSMQSLAFHYAEVGRTSEAKPLWTRLVAVRRRLQGEEHPDTLLAMSGLVEVYRREGRYAEGEELARQVLEARRRVSGEDAYLTIASMGNLANFHAMTRRWDEAEPLYREALEKARRVLGENHPTTNVTAGNLADVYRQQHRFAEAEQIDRETLDRLRRTVGEDHPFTMSAEYRLAGLYDVQGRHADAEAIYRDVLVRRRRVLGEDHYDTLMSVNALAGILAAQGRAADGEALLRQAIDKARRALGEDHPLTTSTRYNLGCLVARRGDRSGALDWLGQAVAHGYSRADSMATDPDLKGLRGDPAFEALVARARKNAAD